MLTQATNAAGVLLPVLINQRCNEEASTKWPKTEPSRQEEIAD